MPRVSTQQLAEKCAAVTNLEIGHYLDEGMRYREIAAAIAHLMSLFALRWPDKDLGHVIAVELGYGAKRVA